MAEKQNQPPHVFLRRVFAHAPSPLQAGISSLQSPLFAPPATVGEQAARARVSERALLKSAPIALCPRRTSFLWREEGAKSTDLISASLRSPKNKTHHRGLTRFLPTRPQTSARASTQNRIEVEISINFPSRVYFFYTRRIMTPIYQTLPERYIGRTTGKSVFSPQTISAYQRAAPVNRLFEAEPTDVYTPLLYWTG
jgi:hypothetical protein